MHHMLLIKAKIEYLQLLLNVRIRVSSTYFGVPKLIVSFRK